MNKHQDDQIDLALNRCVVDILSESQMRDIGRTFVPASEIRKLLTRHGIEHMIVGAHALGEITGEPRATQDVDVIVKQSDFDRTIKTLVGEYHLKASGNRIKDSGGNVVVDVLTDAHPIYATAMRTGNKSPSPEMILVMKFLASVSPLRRMDKRYLDKADFYNVMQNTDPDEEEIMRLLQKADPEYELHKDELKRWLQKR